MINTATQIKMNEFQAAVENMIGIHRQQNFPNLAHTTITLEHGPKFTRVVRSELNSKGVPEHRSVYCFIQNDNGDILKAAGWKAPAKHARGNIFNNLLEGCGPYGADYLK